MKYLIVRYYNYIDTPSVVDVIAKYFYSEDEKKWIYERSWQYGTMLKRIGNVGALQFIDEFYDFIQNGMMNSDVIFRNKELKYFERGADYEI